MKRETLEKPKEIKYHHELLNWLDEKFQIGVDYDTWGAVGPDVLFKTNQDQLRMEYKYQYL